jgi:hypothetical protein
VNKVSLRHFMGFSLVLLLASSAHSADSKSLAALLEVNGVANVIIAAADSLLPTTETCGVTSEESFQISGSVHAAMDGAIADYISSVASTGIYGHKDWVSCMDQCTCSVYSSVLEAVGFEKLKRADKNIYRRVSSLAQEQTREDTTRCVRAHQTYCTSEVLKSARADAN